MQSTKWHPWLPDLSIQCIPWCTVYPNKYAHGFCFAVLCCGYTLTGFPISIRLTSLALWQSNDCPSASKATLMNMNKYFMWIHYERLHNHNKAKHNKTVCIFLGIYCIHKVTERFFIWLYYMVSVFLYCSFTSFLRGRLTGTGTFIWLIQTSEVVLRNITV